MADQNEYDAVASEFLGARKQSTEQNVKLNLSNAFSINPDEAASIQKDASKLGVPVESAMSDPTAIRKQSYFDSIDFSGIVDKLPATTQFFSNQNNANIAHDEVKGLTEIEKTAQVLGTSGRSIARFLADIPAGIYGVGEGIAKTIADPLDWATGGNAPNRFRTWGNELEQLRKSSTKAGDMIQGEMPKDPGVFERNLYNAARSFGDMLPGMAASIITKNPYPALVSAGVVQGGQSTSESLDEGVSPVKALTRGIIDAGWEVMFEKYGVDKLLKDISLKSGFGKILLGQIVREVPGELATTLMQQIDEYAITKPNASFNEFMQQLGPAELDTAVSTVIQTVMTAGLGHGVNRVKQKLDQANDAHQANSSFEVLTKLNDLISANKVKDRDIESFHTFMQSATQDSDVSHVYIEPKVMVQALEAVGVNQEQFAQEAPAIYAQLEQSMATNTDLAISVADFATQLAGKDFSNSLISHLKTDPNGMSQVEAQQYMVEHGNDLKSEVEKILGENSDMQEFHASKDRVKQAILQNLNDSTEWPAIKNENDAELIATRTAVRAAQLHITPEELFQKHLLKVTGNSAQESANRVVLNQTKNKIAEILATPNSKDNSRRVVPLAPVRNWLSKAIKEHTGLDVSKYHHQLDSYAINHTLNNHGDKAKEKSRGQVGITNEDLQMIPEIIDHPDSVILGTKNKKGQDQVFFVKQMPDGTALIVEEIRTGEKTLSVESMRKMAGTKYAKDLIPSVLPNVQNDTSAKPIVIENPDIGNSYNQSNPIFYSGLAKAVLTAKQATAPAKDWLPIINSLPGVKKEEIEWSGIKDYLTMQGKEKLTKEQVAQFINENGVQLNEVMLGNAEIFNQDNYDKLPDDIMGLVDQVDNGEIDEKTFGEMAYDIGYKVNYDRDGSVESIQKIGSGASAPTKYGKWTLPGGENYKELLITLPEQNGVTYTNENVTAIEPQKALTSEEESEYKTLMSKDIFEMTDAEVKRMGDLGSIYTKIASDPDRFWYFNAPEQVFQIPKSKYKTEAEAKAYILREKQPEADPKSNYKSSHWDDLNVLAHIRFNDRTDSEGNKVLFVEEIQSDWHQAGRKKGYRGGSVELDSKYKWDESAKTTLNITEDHQAWIAKDGSGNIVGYYISKEAAQEALSNRASSGSVPNAPLKDTKAWTALAIKRITRYAAENGYDKVAFVNGEQSAERYDLSKEIDEVYYNITAKAFGAYKNGHAVMMKNDVEPVDLEDLIGKETAKKLLDAPIESPGQQGAENIKMQRLKGQELKVGGEGMINYYNKIVPQVVNDVLKKVGGGKIEPMEIGSEKKVTYDQIQEAEKRRDFDEAERLTHIMERQELGHGDESIRGEIESLTQPGFTITPEIRAAVMSGQTLFQPARGQIAFGSDLAKSPSIITLLKSADLSTFLHESGHFFFESDIHLAAELNRTANETGMAFMTEGEQQIMSDVSKMLEWHGLQGTLNEQLNQWYTLSDEERRSYHERTAESFERYLFEGKAPSIELQRIFQTFQAWLMQAYKSIQRFVENNPEAGKLNNEIRQVFDRMLATSEQIQLAQQGRSMMPLFSSADMAGMTEEEFAAYHNQDIESTLQARDTLQARGLRDMQWLQNARSKLIKKMQREHKALREEVMIDARRQILSQPIYKAYSFLTNKMTRDDKIVQAPLPKSDKSKVTPQVDSMFTAIAKLGGLKRDEIDKLMGLDPKMKSPMPGFGKYVFKRTGGVPLDTMGEYLAGYGYLPVDEHGKFDTRDLEDKLDEELRGNPQYSIEVDDRVLRGADKAGLGVDITGLGAGRLDLGELTGEFSPEIIAQLEALKMVSKNGIAPDFVAEQFELGSADEMIRSLLTTPSPKEAINALTDQMMIERYGDLNSPEALDKAADEAIHNEARAKFIATELNALNKAMGKPKVLTSAAKDFAQAMIDRLILRNLRPGQYSASEVRAAKAAEKAMREGNLEVAAAEKRNQIVNGYATKAVYAAQKEVAQIRKFFTQVLGGKDEEIAKYRDMDMVNAARAILAPLGYGGKATVAIDYLSRVKSYDPALHEVLISSVNAAQLVAKPIDDLTVSQLRDIKDEVEALWHLSRRGKQMEIDGDLIDRQEAAEALVTRMQEIGLPENMPGVTSAITEQEVRKSRIQQFKAFLRRVESWVDLKDGMNKMGAFRKYVFTPIKDAANLYRQEKLEYITKFRAAFEGIAKTMEKGQIFASELNYTFGKDSGGVAMNEIMHAILHRGNDSNFRKLLLGRGWATLLDDGSMDTTRWDAFEKRMQKEGKLTKAHYDFAQNIWDLLEEMRPGAQKAHRDAYGRYFAEVTATPFINAFGSYRGGYVPAKVDSRIVKDMELKKLIEEGKDGMMFAFPSTNKGFTKSRVEYNRPLMLDLRTIAQHIDQVLLFTHMENPSRDVAKLIGMPEVSEPLNQQDPEAINSMLTPWLTRSAKQLVTTPVAGAGPWMRLFTFLRARTSMAAMFANVSNTVQQITGFTLAGLKVSGGSMVSSAAKYMANPKQMSEDVSELSMYMAHRMDNQVSAMMGDIQEILLNPSLFEKTQEWTKKHTFFMQSAVDNVMGTIIWSAAYNEAVADGHGSDDAVKIADGIVRSTQGSSLPEDVSRIETGNAFVRMFTLFAGYFNMQANLLGTEFAKIAQEMGMRKGMGRGFYVMLMGFAAPAIVSEMIAQAFRGGPDDDDKDGEYLDDWLMSVLVWGQIRYATAFIPGGNALNSTITRFNSNPMDDRVSLSPVVNILEASASVPSDLLKLSEGKGNEQKTIRDVASLISLTVGLPANILARPLGYLAGIDQGKTKPTSDADMVRGLITGTASPPSKQR